MLEQLQGGIPVAVLRFDRSTYVRVLFYEVVSCHSNIFRCLGGSHTLDVVVIIYVIRNCTLQVCHEFSSLIHLIYMFVLLLLFFTVLFH